MAVTQLVLGLLAKEPAHGYTLKRRHDLVFATGRPLPYGQLYATLGRLRRDGLAEVSGVEVAEGPERSIYAITPTGVTSFERWLREPIETTSGAVGVLVAKVALALLSGRSTAEVLDVQREVHLARMRVLNRARRHAEGVELLAVTYELAHLDADLRWIEESAQRVGAVR